MHTTRKFAAALAALALGLTVAACGGDDGDTASGGGGENLSGNIAIDGSSTAQPFAEAAAETFNEEQPDVKITVGGSGTGDGFEKFCRGETQISDASRPIEDDEQAACEKAGVDFTELQVANDGITVVTNKDLAVECLTTDQLADIFGPDAKAAKYSDVDPKLPDTDISLYTPGSESGTFDFFTETINGEEGVQREGGIVQTSADDNQIVTGIEGEAGAMGYFGFSYYEQNQEELNAVAVDGGDGCVEPSSETIQDGSYKPLARPIYMYVSKKALSEPQVKGFLDFTLDQHATISEAAQTVPMNDGQAEESKRALAGARS